MMSPALSRAIETSGACINWIGDQVDGLDLAASRRMKLAGACMLVSLTHHGSIPSLIKDGRLVSAFALLRPQIDSYIRGLWIAYLARDEEIDGVCNGDDPPSTRKLILQLEASGHFDPQSLSTIGQAIWPTVCDFTHTGIRVLVRHLTPTEIAPAFEDDEILEVLASADSWAYLAAISIAGLAENDALAKRLLDRARANAGETLFKTESPAPSTR